MAAESNLFHVPEFRAKIESYEDIKQKYPSSLRHRNDVLKKHLLILCKPIREDLENKAPFLFHLQVFGTIREWHF